MKLGRVNKGNLQEKNMQGVAAELLFYSASFQRKIEEVVCIAEFVSKASPNIKEHKIYFKIAGIQLLSALSWTTLPFLVRLQVSKAFLCTTKQSFVKLMYVINIAVVK